MTSHEYANELKKIADSILERQEFTMPSHYNEKSTFASIHFFSDKEGFLAAARSLGSFDKRIDSLSHYYEIAPKFSTHFEVSANRDAVCRLIRPAQDAQYECEPLLSREEEAQLNA